MFQRVAIISEEGQFIELKWIRSNYILFEQIIITKW
jgi:hypothetical protein